MSHHKSGCRQHGLMPIGPGHGLRLEPHQGKKDQAQDNIVDHDGVDHSRAFRKSPFEHHRPQRKGEGRNQRKNEIDHRSRSLRPTAPVRT